MPDNNNNDYITRQEFEEYKTSISKKFEDSAARTTDILVSIGQLTVKVDELKNDITDTNKKLEELFAKGRNNVNTIMISTITCTLGCIITYIVSKLFS